MNTLPALPVIDNALNTTGWLSVTGCHSILTRSDHYLVSVWHADQGTQALQSRSLRQLLGMVDYKLYTQLFKPHVTTPTQTA
jgi:hypothetical protein